MHMDVICPTCDSNYNLVHLNCTDYLEYCSCNLEGIEEFYCSSCYLGFDIDMDDRKYDSEVLLEKFSSNTQLFDPATVKTIKPKPAPHSHDQIPIKLEDGTIIHCSSHNSKREDSEHADYGLYADHIWRPVHRNEFISWPDFRIPDDPDLALHQMIEAFERARDYNEKVQIGCIGGHGRTGTILAIMALYASDGGWTPEKAIKFVRKEYCGKAIENKLQEWYISYASNVWYGTDLPEQPELKIGANPPGKVTHLCSKEEHFAMILRGHSLCVAKVSCQLFNIDANSLKDKGFKEVDKAKVYSLLPNYTLLKKGIKLPGEHECTPDEHFELMEQGYDKCLQLGCPTWEDDEKVWSK